VRVGGETCARKGTELAQRRTCGGRTQKCGRYTHTRRASYWEGTDIGAPLFGEPDASLGHLHHPLRF